MGVGCGINGGPGRNDSTNSRRYAALFIKIQARLYGGALRVLVNLETFQADATKDRVYVFHLIARGTVNTRRHDRGTV